MECARKCFISLFVYICLLLVTKVQFVFALDNSTVPYFIGPYPPGCDVDAAAQCEAQQLRCQLFSGPAGDPATQCLCAKEFYGVCLRKAGCQFAVEVAALSAHQIYEAMCVKNIMQYNCSDTTVCSVNCASEGLIDRYKSKIMPFNNYGKYYLRIRICNYGLHTDRLKKYNQVEEAVCKFDEFTICNVFIPPMTFVPVALPLDTTYLEIDSCVLNPDGTYFCHVTSDPMPTRIFGNKFIFPRSFDVAQTSSSICYSDDQCLGSFCDIHFRPPVCSAKTLVHVQRPGAYYFSDPFG